jgi:hypothetical protein
VDGPRAVAESRAAGLGEAAEPEPEPVGPVRDVDAGGHAPIAQLVQRCGSHAEQVLDGRGRVRKQQCLSQAAVVGSHRPCRAALGKPEAEAQERHVRRLAVSMGAGGLHVGAFDEPDVDAGVGQRVDIGRGAQEIRL